MDVHLGDRFGRWTVIDPNCGPLGKESLCTCECGTVRKVDNNNLVYGYSRSCGCLRRGNKSGMTHGLSKTRLYHVWSGMISRCHNERSSAYRNYGARGITVCAEWHDFLAFHDWSMANGYDPEAPRGECTIDRIDNDKGYSPDNCRWTTMREQSNNTRNSSKLLYKGKMHTAAELAKVGGMSSATFWQRLHRGWSVEEAVEVPLGTVTKDCNLQARRKRVDLIEESGGVIETYDSIKSASVATGCSESCIGQVCRGFMESTKGLRFRYSDASENGPSLLRYSDSPESRPHRSTKGVKIDMLDRSGQTVRTFESMTDAAVYLGKSTVSAISLCCRGRTKSAYGYGWRYSQSNN